MDVLPSSLEDRFFSFIELMKAVYAHKPRLSNLSRKAKSAPIDTARNSKAAARYEPYNGSFGQSVKSAAYAPNRSESGLQRTTPLYNEASYT